MALFGVARAMSELGLPGPGYYYVQSTRSCAATEEIKLNCMVRQDIGQHCSNVSAACHGSARVARDNEVHLPLGARRVSCRGQIGQFLGAWADTHGARRGAVPLYCVLLQPNPGGPNLTMPSIGGAGRGRGRSGMAWTTTQYRHITDRLTPLLHRGPLLRMRQRLYFFCYLPKGLGWGENSWRQCALQSNEIGRAACAFA